MPCCGGRELEKEMKAEQKWDYINLSDFRSSSCFTPFSYGILYLSLLVSIAVYSVDTFTAINLLAFNRWSGEVKPKIPFEVSKWIFAACIILSWVILAFEWLRAVRVMKRGGIAESYLDPLAVRVQSIRVGKNGRGWRRFLVFAELTKSKKGTEYIALLTHFSFKAWLRIIFAEGPRQVVNALTLYSVVQANLVPVGSHAASQGHTPVIQFFVNIGILADSSRTQAVILSGMLFTLVIWVVTALNLILAVLMYLLFLWHHIPSSDGGLTGYCRRKIEGRLNKIVNEKVRKALDRENIIRSKEEAKTFKGGDAPRSLKREPTLPLFLTNQASESPEKLASLSRENTNSTLPLYSLSSPSRLEVRRLGCLSISSDEYQISVPPSRSGTQSSAISSRSNISTLPLTYHPAAMGYDAADRMIPSSSILPESGDFELSKLSWHDKKPLNRSFTGSFQHHQGHFVSTRMLPISPVPQIQQDYCSPLAFEPHPPRSLQHNKTGIKVPSLTMPVNVSPPGSFVVTPAFQDQKIQLQEGDEICGNQKPEWSDGRITPSPSTRAQKPRSNHAGEFKAKSSDSTRYVAFSPSVRSLPQISPFGDTPPSPNDNFAELYHYQSPSVGLNNCGPFAPTTREITPQHDTYDISIYDSYEDEDIESQDPPRFPSRADTTTPSLGTRDWQAAPQLTKNAYRW